MSTWINLYHVPDKSNPTSPKFKGDLKLYCNCIIYYYNYYYYFFIVWSLISLLYAFYFQFNNSGLYCWVKYELGGGCSIEVSWLWSTTMADKFPLISYELDPILASCKRSWLRTRDQDILVWDSTRDSKTNGIIRIIGIHPILREKRARSHCRQFTII